MITVNWKNFRISSRLVLACTLWLNAIALYKWAWPLYETNSLFVSRKWIIIIGSAFLVFLVTTGLLAASWTSLWRKISALFKFGQRHLSRLGRINLILFFLIIGVFSFMVLGQYGVYLGSDWVRRFFLWLVVMAGAFLLRAAGFNKTWEELLVGALLITMLGFKIATYSGDISTYPFSLNWSEASRYYYASLFFSKQIYGIAVPPSVLHPTRYLLQSIAFLIPNSPLWFHRLWQVILWVVITLVTSILFARILKIQDQLRRWMLIAWAFLFLLLGPVYYHLLVSAALVLWGYDRQRPWRTWIVILVASVWAGVSRVNWFPVPGMLASMLYFLEEPVENQALWRYLLKPFAWTSIGTILAFATQATYAFLSGNPPEEFTSSFTSDLLWYRLLPNPTDSMGIILSALLVSLPLFLIILYQMRHRWRSYHPIRLLGLGAILAVLLGGGMIVSTKIGGGSNLHNLDAYLTLLMLASGYLFFGKIVPEEPETPVALPHWSLIVIAILLPVYFVLPTGGLLPMPGPEATSEALATINQQIDEATQDGGEVLFISERELLTFHMLDKQVPLVPDYERVFLMEMAMAGNPYYLGKFHDDIKNQRYEMIVSEPLFTQLKGRSESFGEENDAWVNQVSIPVLCYYTPERTLRDVHIQLLVPRPNPENCP
jgi:hypothetical protein